MRLAAAGLAILLLAAAVFVVRHADGSGSGAPTSRGDGASSDNGRVQRYGPGKAQFGELWLPDGPGPHPVVVLIHGGFWRAEYGLDLMDGLAEDLTRRGFAAWNIEYRRVGGGGGGFPATLDDVGAAVDHLATMAATHHLDLGRVTTVGHSAGGQLALWVASRPDAKVKVAKAISLAGVTDLVEADRVRLGGDAVRQLLGGRADDVPDRYAAASPAAHLPLGIPQVLVHGTADDLVPVSFSREYAAAARRAGDDVDLVELDGADHFAVIDPQSKAWSEVVARL